MAETGLSPGGSLLVVWFLYSDVKMIEDARMLWLPFYKHGIPLAGWVFIALSILYITATSNAVNLTDEWIWPPAVWGLSRRCW